MPGKILIIQPLPGIGDMIWHLPAIRSIANTSANKKISILAKPSAQVHKLLAHEGILDEVINLDPQAFRTQPWVYAYNTSKIIKEKSFDEVYVLHHSTSLNLIAFLARIPKRYGYGFGKQKIFLNSGRVLPKHDYFAHNIDKSYKFLHLNGFDDFHKLHYLSVDPKAQLKINAQLSLPRPWFTLGIGATEQRRIWPSHNFAAVANKMSRKYGGTVFLLGVKNEEPIVEVIKRYSPQCVNFIGAPLEESVALIAASDVFIGNDSGLMNIAASLGKPVLGIFRDNNILQYVDNITAVYPQLAGIENVMVEEIIAACDKILLDQELSRGINQCSPTLRGLKTAGSTA